MLSATDESELQTLLLRAVLSGTALPGAEQPVHLPDLQFVLQQSSIIVLDENLSASASTAGAPQPVRVMSANELRLLTEQQGDTAYLQFAPPDVAADHVGITLAARIATGDPARRPLGLSSIHVRFRKVGGNWVTVGEPVYSAS